MRLLINRGYYIVANHFTAKFGYNWDGPRCHLGPTFLVPEKFSPRMKIIVWQFHAVTNIRGSQISRDPNFLGTKKIRGPNEIGGPFQLQPKIHILDNEEKVYFQNSFNKFFLIFLLILGFNESINAWKSPCNSVVRSD